MIPSYSNEPSYNHTYRKVIQYVAGANDYDESGHGTGVAGTSNHVR
jgi:hypothetical protein